MTIDAVPMDFEEPAGTLKHINVDAVPTFFGGSSATLYFRRMDTCTYFEGEPGETQEGQPPHPTPPPPPPLQKQQPSVNFIKTLLIVHHKLTLRSPSAQLPET